MSTCSRCGAPLESRLAWSRAAHHGAESILQAVLLARPDRFHGRADFSGDARGHDGFLGEEAPAEATAHPGRVHGNGRRGQEQRQGDFPLHLRGRLGGSPDLGSEAMHASGGVERLELHVHEERGLVGCAYERVRPTDRLRQRVGSQALEQRRAQALGVRRVRRHAPAHGSALQAPECAPGIPGDHSERIVEVRDVDYAGAAQRRLPIEGPEPSARDTGPPPPRASRAGARRARTPPSRRPWKPRSIGARLDRWSATPCAA